MKIVKNLEVICVVLALAGAGVSSAITPPARPVRPVVQPVEVNPVAIVHVVGKRLSEEEKKALEG